MGLIFAKLWGLFGNDGRFHINYQAMRSTCVCPGSDLYLKLYSIAEHKILMVGLDNAGKTTILYQFLMNEVVQTSPTIGSNVEEVVFRNIHFLVWDLGGKFLKPSFEIRFPISNA